MMGSGVLQAKDSPLSGGKAAHRMTARDTATAIDNQRRNFALHAQNDTINTRLPVSDLRRHVVGFAYFMPLDPSAPDSMLLQL